MGGVDVERAEHGEERIQAPEQGVAVHRDDGVALQQTRLVGWTAGFDGDDQEPAFLSKLARQGLAQPDRLGARAEMA